MVCYRYVQLNLLLNPTIQTKQGHYARKRWSPNGRPQLLSAKDQTKDQSYYLSSISEQGLARALFPLGEITKVEVRELARKYQLATAEKPESMGLCFVGERGKFSQFLSKSLSNDALLASQLKSSRRFLPQTQSRSDN